MASIEDFVSELRTNSTRKTYRAGIYAFLDWKYGPQRAGKKATDEEMKRYEDLINQYLSARSDYGSDLRKFAVSMQSTPPLTAQVRMTAIRMFLQENNIELSGNENRKIKSKMPRGGAISVERDLDHELLKSLLMHADLKSTALILTLISSGMRIGECLALRIQDVHLETDPAQITIRSEHTKTREKRTTFVSREAAVVLREWLDRGREKYLQAAQNRNAGLVERGIGSVKSVTDPRLFPFSDHVAEEAWKTTVKNAGLYSPDESTGRGLVRIHACRKFFRSQLALSCPVDIVEALMGHGSYLSAAYRRYSLKQMGEYYQKAEHLVTITLTSKEVNEAVKEQMKGHEVMIGALMEKNKQLESELRGIKTIIEAVAQNPEILQKRSRK